MKEKIAKYSAIYCVVVMITIAIIAYAGRHFIILVLPVTALLSFPFFNWKYHNAFGFRIPQLPTPLINEPFIPKTEKKRTRSSEINPPLRETIRSYDIKDIPMPTKTRRDAPVTAPTLVSVPAKDKSKPLAARESCALLKPELAPPKQKQTFAEPKIGESFSIFLDEPSEQLITESEEIFIRQEDIFL
ncbi:hypothetical protein [Pseudomonas lactis]|uniref:hypothetical protein n=1 Tax=Pseudomonas lactis TaxID=1615674 RepID=UPI003F7ED53D